MSFKQILLYNKQTPFQRINFFTETNGSYSLTLDDYWQFNSAVEHIYHECLFTLPAIFPAQLRNAAILGGGDGLGARELLNFPSLQKIENIELDPEMVKFAKDHFIMRGINKGSFHHPKVSVMAADAKKWLDEPTAIKYDLIIIDFPDPTTDDLWTLYTEDLYRKVLARLSPTGVVAIQSSTYNTRSYELIFEKLAPVFPYILGYHTGASSVFCGFFLCSSVPIKKHRELPKSCRWLTPRLVNSLLALPIYNLEERQQKSLSPFAMLQTSKKRRLYETR